MINQARFANLWQRLGGQGDANELFDSLLAAYAETPRAYHNIAHLQDCLTQLDAARSEAQRPDEVEMALWFHDAIYDPRAIDNEAQSAAWVREALTAGGVEQAVIERIAGLVLETQHKTMPSSQDAALLVDFSLDCLAQASHCAKDTHCLDSACCQRWFFKSKRSVTSPTFAVASSLSIDSSITAIRLPPDSRSIVYSCADSRDPTASIASRRKGRRLGCTGSS